jgi:UDP-glucose 4-epimerase
LKNRYPKKIGSVVTGVAGFVGSHLAEGLLSENHHVVGVDNFFSGHKENLTSLLEHPDFTFLERSVTEAGLLRELRAQYPNLEYCFHLAAIVSVPYSIEHPEAVMAVNHHGTVHLLREAEQLEFKGFVFAGSSAEYGDENRLPLREEYTTETTRHLSAYGLSKYLASREVAEGCCGVALRCFNIYGPRQDPGSPYSGVISRFVSMALSGKPLTVFGDGRQTRDFIYVSDVVRAYLDAAKLGNSFSGAGRNVYNVGTGKSTTIMQLAETISSLVGDQGRVAYCPERPGDIRFSVASIEAFRRAAGWEPRVLLREGLGKTIEWARAVGK